jgi:hypothetical protein
MRRKCSPRIIALVITMAAASGYSKTGFAQNVDVEEELRELRRMVLELRQVVERQDSDLREQQWLIEELREQLYSPETAARLAPHLDKHLLHERDRLGEQLGDLRVAVGLTGIVQSSIDAEDLSGEDSDGIDGSWSADVEVESPVGENGLAFILVEAGEGEGLTDELSLLYQNVNDDAGETESGLEVTEAWYQRNFLSERLFLVAGKLDMTNYFDENEAANDERYEFLNTALVNSIAVEFPDNGPGAVAAGYPAEWLELSAGWATGDGEWEDLDSDAFGIAQVHFKPLLFEKPGNYRFYAWVNNTDKGEVGGDSSEEGWGAGISFDQLLTEHIIGFLRAGFQDDDVYEVEAAWSAGAEISGALWNREMDTAGIAVAQALVNDDIDPDDTESLFEAYYSFAVNEWLHLSPDLQVIDNPAGDDENDTVVVLGTRAQVDF